MVRNDVEVAVLERLAHQLLGRGVVLFALERRSVLQVLQQCVPLYHLLGSARAGLLMPVLLGEVPVRVKES